jgi:hypothetical protein
MKISESHASFPFWIAKLPPCKPMHFITVVIISPPEFGYSIRHPFTHPLWDKEDRHGIDMELHKNPIRLNLVFRFIFPMYGL